MLPTNTAADYEGTFTELAILMDLAMAANPTMQEGYLAIWGVSYTPVCTEEQHAEYAKSKRIARAHMEAQVTGVLR